MSQSTGAQGNSLDAHNASELRVQVRKLAERNSSLASLLQDSRNKLQQLAADVNDLAEPASTYGIFLGYSGRPQDSRRDAEVYTNNRPMRLKISPQIEPGSLEVGQLVRLGEGVVVVEAAVFHVMAGLPPLQNVLAQIVLWFWAETMKNPSRSSLNACGIACAPAIAFC